MVSGEIEGLRSSRSKRVAHRLVPTEVLWEISALHICSIVLLPNLPIPDLRPECSLWPSRENGLSRRDEMEQVDLFLTDPTPSLIQSF